MELGYNEHFFKKNQQNLAQNVKFTAKYLQKSNERIHF